MDLLLSISEYPLTFGAETVALISECISLFHQVEILLCAFERIANVLPFPDLRKN